jgi:hypothetical protein
MKTMTTKANNATKNAPFQAHWDVYQSRLQDVLDGISDDVRRDLCRERVGQALLFRAGGAFKKYINKKGDDNLVRAITYLAAAHYQYGQSNFVSKKEVEDSTVKGGLRPQEREDRIQYGIDQVVSLFTDTTNPSQVGSEEADKALAELDAMLGIDMGPVEEQAKLAMERENSYKEFLRPKLRDFLEGGYYETPDVAPSEFDGEEARISYVKCLEAVERKIVQDVAKCREFYAQYEVGTEMSENWRNNAFLAASDLKLFNDEKARHAD